MTILPKRYLHPPRFFLRPHSSLSNLCLALLLVFLLDSVWIIVRLPNPIRTITPPYSAIETPGLTSNQDGFLTSSSQGKGMGQETPFLPSDMKNTQAVSGSKPQIGIPNNETIFIAAIFRSSEIMLRENWSSALMSLVKHLGPQNVYVSILESGSWDGTKAALMELDGMLGEVGVERTIDLGMDSRAHVGELKRVPAEGEDMTGWLHTRREEIESGWEMRRIPHLAKLRNKAMEPLLRVWDEGRGRRFDRILWINDVVFTTADVTTLLATNNHSYAAACALDFSHPTKYYDTFALRDSSGRKTVSLSWPYFYSSQSLNSLEKNEAVPVKSCWNGMVVFDGEAWYPTSSSSSSLLPTTTPKTKESGSQETLEKFKGLKFRGISDSLAQKHVEGSECCLIHADNPFRETRGVFLNPNVRVGYKRDVYEVVNGVGGWLGGREAVRGVWRVRMGWVREWSWGWVERMRVGRRIRVWVREGEGEGMREERVEKGTECLINEMQVLYQNGWKHL